MTLMTDMTLMTLVSFVRSTGIHTKKSLTRKHNRKKNHERHIFQKTGLISCRISSLTND
jgi:hypothetical protein